MFAEENHLIVLEIRDPVPMYWSPHKYDMKDVVFYSLVALEIWMLRYH